MVNKIAVHHIISIIGNVFFRLLTSSYFPCQEKSANNSKSGYTANYSSHYGPSVGAATCGCKVVAGIK